LIEKNTGKNYNLADNVDVTIEWDKTKEITIENELKKSQIRIIKVDMDNNEIKLEGVKFDVIDTQTGKTLETITTNKNGEAYTSRYPTRDYEELTLKEIETIYGYSLNTESKTLKLESNKVIDVIFENEVKKGQVKIIKVDKDNNEIKLEGIEFNLMDENNNVLETLITDKNRRSYIKEISNYSKIIFKGRKNKSELQLKWRNNRNYIRRK